MVFSLQSFYHLKNNDRKLFGTICYDLNSRYKYITQLNMCMIWVNKKETIKQKLERIAQGLYRGSSCGNIKGLLPLFDKRATEKEGIFMSLLKVFISCFRKPFENDIRHGILTMCQTIDLSHILIFLIDFQAIPLCSFASSKHVTYSKGRRIFAHFIK